nr:probable ubiquitin-conjugating enzyme E2 24 isoform X1 [Solanum lycopersicum]XP_019068836.1 probable ubiquitin-conjugating enzyme E2 24 isoform X1 [Solanum lycopersicum]
MEGEDNAKLDSPPGLPVDNDSVSDNAGEELENDRGRMLRLGDFVAHISDLDKALGQVVQINQSFLLYDVKKLKPSQYIPSNQLKRVTKFLEGDMVVLNNWLGRVDFVLRDVTVRFMNGSLRTFKGGMGLQPHDDWDGLSLHLGQKVNVSPKRTCTITELVDGSVYVIWIISSDGNDDSPPLAKQDPDRLTQVFPFCSTWKIGNVCGHELSKSETEFLLGDVETSVDVTWQNGITEKNLPSSILKPISDLGVHDFFIGQYVVLDNSDGLGVVKSVDHKEKTTTVRWLNIPNEEIISSCQLNRLFNYHLGNLVLRRITREAENSHLSSFGNIIGFKDGNIEVTWADGTISMVQPQELHGVIDRDKYEDTDEFASNGIEQEVEEDALVVKVPEFKVRCINLAILIISFSTPFYHMSVLTYINVLQLLGDEQVDLLDFVDLRCVRCLNGSRIHCFNNALEKDYRELKGLTLESVADEQLLIYLPFYQPINLHSLVIGGLMEEGPKTVKLFANKRHFDISDAAKTTPRDTAILSEDNLRGVTVKVNQINFQRIHSLTIFIEDNQYGSELTRVQRLYLFGTLN